MVSVPGADQKDRGLWGQECFRTNSISRCCPVARFEDRISFSKKSFNCRHCVITSTTASLKVSDKRIRSFDFSCKNILK